jgi:1,4-dihydroxy-2-naphthoate octaprenyltransferase
MLIKSQFKSQLKYGWLAIRPSTLLASIGPILLGTALATRDVDINMAIFFSILVCALSLQIAVNLANDLFDSLSGVNNKQRVGPLRVVQAGLISLSAIKLGLALICTVAML